MKPTITQHRAPSTTAASQRGFTMAEVLVAGVLGAILLTAISNATYSFALTVAHLEDSSDLTDDEDTVMRLMTRDIREAWWATLVSASHLKLLNDEGIYIEYYLQNNSLIKSRSDGTPDTLLSGVSSLAFTATSDSRLREAAPQAMTGLWYDHADSSFPELPLPLAVGNKLALGLTVPAIDSDLPTIVSTSNEELVGTSMGSVSLHMAWVAGTDPQNLTIDVYETRGPGKAAPRGASLGTVSLPGSSLPTAVPSGTSWVVPSVDVTVNLGSMGGSLLPGAGYTLVFSATGDAQLVFAAQPVLAGTETDYLAIQDAVPGSQFVDQPLLVDYSLNGSHSLTSTSSTAAVTSVTVVLTPTNRPSQTRSASLLSQNLNESGWYGALEGEVAP